MKTQKMTYKCDNAKWEPVFQLKLEDWRLVDVIRKAPNHYVRPIPEKPWRNIWKKVSIIEVENRGFRLRAIARATILTLLLVLFLFWGLKNISDLMSVQNVYWADWTAPEKENLENRKPVSRRRLNTNWYSQRYFELTGENKDERAVQLLQNYGMWQNEWSAIKTISRIHRIYPEVFLCLWYAETSLGKFYKSSSNIANIWNNDRWDTISFINLEQGFNAIWIMLNNRYMKNKTSMWDLFPFNIQNNCQRDCQYAYATSKENAFNNNLNCLGMIHKKEISPDFNFRW